MLVLLLLLFIPTIYCAPTIRPRQFPTGGFPTMDFPTDMTFPDFTGFDTTFPDFTGFDTSFPDFTGFDTSFPDFTGFDTHLPTGFPTFPGPPPSSHTPAETRQEPVSTRSTTSTPTPHSTPNNPQNANESAPTRSSTQSSLSPPAASTDSKFYDPFDSYSRSVLSFGSIMGIVFGCLGGFTVLFVLYYLYHQHNKQANSLKRQLASGAYNNNNSNPRPSQHYQQNTTTAAGASEPTQSTEFNYGANYQPYQPYREQMPSPPPVSPRQSSFPTPVYGTHHSQQSGYQQQQNDSYHHQQRPSFPVPAVAASPAHSTFETFPMPAIPNHRQQPSPTQLNDAHTSSDIYPPAPPYEHFVPKPDAVASPIMTSSQPTAVPNTNMAITSSTLSSHADKTYNDITTDKPHSRN